MTSPTVYSLTDSAARPRLVTGSSMITYLSSSSLISSSSSSWLTLWTASLSARPAASRRAGTRPPRCLSSHSCLQIDYCSEDDWLIRKLFYFPHHIITFKHRKPLFLLTDKSPNCRHPPQHAMRVAIVHTLPIVITVTSIVSYIVSSIVYSELWCSPPLHSGAQHSYNLQSFITTHYTSWWIIALIITNKLNYIE